MHILVMASGWEPEIVGGIKRYQNEVLPRLKARGHEVMVISSSKYHSGLVENLGIPVRYIKYSGGFSTIITVPKKLAWGLFYLIKFRPNVVFAQKAANAIYAPIFRLLGVPTVCHSHGVFRFVESHLSEAMDYYRKKDTAKWLIAKVAPFIEGFSMKSCKAVIVFTKFHAEHLTERDGLPMSKMRVIPNGVDTAKFNPLLDGSKFRKRFNLQGMVVGYCGRIVFLKGIDTLIEAISIAKEKNPDVKLCLVGDFPEHPKTYWEEMVRSKNLEDRVVFTESIEDEWMPYAYKAFDVYCQLTAPTYGFEIAMCEAMACGKPVISTKAVERDEIFGDAYYPCEWKDAKSTAEAINTLLRSPGLCKEMGDKARIKMMEYDWNKIVDSVEKVLAGS